MSGDLEVGQPEPRKTVQIAKFRKIKKIQIAIGVLWSRDIDAGESSRCLRVNWSLWIGFARGKLQNASWKFRKVALCEFGILRFETVETRGKYHERLLYDHRNSFQKREIEEY